MSNETPDNKDKESTEPAPSPQESSSSKPGDAPKRKPADVFLEFDADQVRKREGLYADLQSQFGSIYAPASSINIWKTWATAVSPSLYIPSEELSGELSRLRKETRELAQSLDAEKRESAKYIQGQKDLQEKAQALEQKTLLSYILSNIRPDAQEKIFKDENFRSLFEKTTHCNSFVLSIDIRRSTELMLKARQPELFAQFIRKLCVALSEIIIGNFGVFDKFTGDGVLAYFPDFYSGPDAGLLALDSALKAHVFFAEHYKDHRHCFTSVLNEIGLGVGIDFGDTYTVKIQGSLTLVGTPVVYACRLSGAKAGDTLLNQPAYEVIFDKYRGYFNFDETALTVKNEGETLAYRIASNKGVYSAATPDWDALVREFGGRCAKE